MSDIVVVPKDSRVYNATDAEGHCRGIALKAGKKVKSLFRVYSVYRIENDVAHCQSWDILGGQYDESFPVSTLRPYTPPRLDMV